MGLSGCVVVKLGGSLAEAELLAEGLRIIGDAAGSVAVAPGGGPFADAVRRSQPRIGYGHAAAQQMVLLALAQFAVALGSLRRNFVLQTAPGASRAR